MWIWPCIPSYGRSFDRCRVAEEDGKLSNNEMVAVMRRRMRRGLERPRDTGLFRLLDALVLCGKRTYHASPLPFY
ncbi:hypothetical protein ANCDUO_27742 [Ancylostoma duodenale]|uniref:Uncharacterized protein n=1 Tax=Ancylostoma duodenale TaxID=51022 RepID=A0A0C2FB40_9BILA|nr:hypothetical protein ANCDUO_27742 [Ancylostoma duodenale]